MKKRKCVILHFIEEKEGIFHTWGNRIIFFHGNPIQETIAIVETSDGLVHEVLPSNLKFI